jgi:Ca2+-binding RTX toxin-like protein
LDKLKRSLTGTNRFTGTAGDDTFDAGLSTGSLQTLNSGDQLDGGAGTDDLIAVVNGSVTPASLKNIENVYITNTATGSTVDLSNGAGLQNAVSQGSSATLTIQGISKAVNATVQDTRFDHTITYNDVTGSADAATITLQNVTNSVILTTAGVETLTLKTAGGVDNVLGVPALGTAATKLVVTGTSGLTLGTLATNNSAITVLDASAHAPTTNVGVTTTMGATLATTVLGGSRNDSITLASTGAESISMGAGNDTVIYTAANQFTVLDTIDGGAGTDDLRMVSADIATTSATTPTTYTVTNVETISNSDALGSTTYVPANISASVTRFNVRGALDTAITGGNNTITGPAGSFTVGLGQASTAAAGANDAGILGANTLTLGDTGTGVTDTVTLINSATDASAQINVYNGTAVTTSGYETLVLNTGSTASRVYNSFGAITVVGDTGGTSAETVRFTGANPVNATAIITADIIDASALTHVGTGVTNTTASFFMANVAHTATTVTGSAGPDQLVAATAGSSLDGGAGNDSLVGAAGNDTLLGGAGADTVSGGAGNDSVDGGIGNDSLVAGAGNDTILGGAGDDTVDMAANLASGDSLVGGDGTDTLLITRNATAPTAAAVAQISGFETLQVSGADGGAATAVTLSNFTTNVFTRLEHNVSGTGAITYTSAADSLRTLAITNTTTQTAGSTTFTRLVDGSANVLTLEIGDIAATPATLVSSFATNINDEETITINSVGLATGNNITTLSATDAVTITLTGSKNLTVGTLTANDVLTTLNAGAFTGSLNFGATALTNSANMTVTGPTSIAATISGGQGNDTITGGIGDDSLLGGSGNDSIVGGVGNDVLTGGAGSDSLVGGDGTDTFSAVGMNAASIDGTTATSTGAVVNLGSAALTATAIGALLGSSNAIGGAVSEISTNLVSVGGGQAAYLYGSAVAGSSALDTISGVENITGSTGIDYLVGSSGANTITGGVGRDVLTGGSGADRFFYTTGATELVTYAGANTTPVNVERITDFVAGTDQIAFSVGGVLSGITLTATTGFTLTTVATPLVAGAATITALTAAMEAAQAGVASTAGAAGAATGLQLYLFTTAGTLGTLSDGRTFLVINDGTGTIAATDTIIDLTGISGTLTAADFIIV